ncbi:putative membrane protein YpjA [Desulfitispora alkaliphila]|uniref:DUF1405 domain-containing protein n=1 Tax=Desulfitispora alkaliphila TaxID=622674 RepID=UPI003D1DA816
MSYLWYDLLENPTRPIYLKLLLIVNVPGSVLGYLWYENHLRSTEIIYWPFVPDSPLATTIFSIVLFTLLYSEGNSSLHKLFQLLAYTAVVKYGIWAIFVLSLNWMTGGSMVLMDWVLWFSHLGMAIEGIIFWRKLVYEQIHAYGVWVWMYINDYMDYWVGLHPYLPNYDHRGTVLLFTVGLTTTVGFIARRKSSLPT